MVWALDYQPALTSAAALPPVTLTEEEAGFNLHHEAGTARSLMGVYVSSINMLENMLAGQESIYFNREFANPTLI